MIANLLCIVGLIFQPLLMVPSCACLDNACDGVTSGSCCQADAECSSAASEATPPGGCSECDCCPETSARCCPVDDRDSAACRKFSNPVCVIPLASDACPCGCCSGPMAPVSGETAPVTVRRITTPIGYTPPNEVVARTARLERCVQDPGSVAGACDSVQSRLCVWLK